MRPRFALVTAVLLLLSCGGETPPASCGANTCNESNGGGACDDASGSAVCTCNEGYSGSTCDSCAVGCLNSCEEARCGDGFIFSCTGPECGGCSGYDVCYRGTFTLARIPTGASPEFESLRGADIDFTFGG